MSQRIDSSSGSQFWDNLSQEWQEAPIAGSANAQNTAESTEVSPSWIERTPSEQILYLRRRLRRQSWRMRVTFVLEALICAFCLYLAAILLLQTPRSLTNAATALGLVSLALVCAGFAIVNRRGIWSSMGEDPFSYVSLLVKRLQRLRQYMRFSIGLALVEFVGFGFWLPTQQPRSLVASGLLLVALCGGAVLISLWFLVRIQRELGPLQDLLAQLSDKRLSNAEGHAIREATTPARPSKKRPTHSGVRIKLRLSLH